MTYEITPKNLLAYDMSFDAVRDLAAAKYTVRHMQPFHDKLDDEATEQRAELIALTNKIEECRQDLLRIRKKYNVEATL